MREAGPYEQLLRALTDERFSSAAQPLSEAGGSGRGSDGQGAEGADAVGPAVLRSPGGDPGAGKLLLRVEEAAALLDVGRSRIYDLIKSGALQSVKIGGSRRVPAIALQRYVEDLLHDRD